MFDLDDMFDRPKKTKAQRDLELVSAMMKTKCSLDKNSNGFSSDDELIDWDDIDAKGASGDSSKWANYPAVEKQFYFPHKDLENFTFEQIEKWRLDNHNIKVEHLTKSDKITKLSIEEIPKPSLTFEGCFEKYPDILKTIKDQKFEKPSPIQSQFWPCAMTGHDVIGIAQTGTGKTLAFLLPMFIHIKAQKIDHTKRKGPIALILSPTRELAQQIAQEISKYTYQNINHICIYGGTSMTKQRDAINRGCEIVVATPGRFNDMVGQKIINLDYVSYVVLDEADRMLDMGFEPQILKIFLDIRPDRTTLMTSATWPEGVRRLCNTYLNNPIQIVVGNLDLAAVHTVTQYIKLLSDESLKEQTLHYYLNKMTPKDKAIIFCGRKASVDHLSSNLSLKSIENDAMHGGREQEDRERALKDFRSGAVRILFATDVASRGIDVSDITIVINYDFPRNMEEYVHRVGRTGRQGKKGRSVTFFTRRDWSNAKELIEILEKTKQKVPDQLRSMAERYIVWKEKKIASGEHRGFRNSRIKYRQ